jgi:putative tryptophan/tyrosine transport system substrate-binding protein
MRRREFLGGLLASVGLPARAQQTPGVVGFLSSGSQTTVRPVLEGFKRGLAETGYSEGKNVTIDYLWAEGRYERLPMLASELVRRSVNVIAATGGSVSALAAKAATSTIPIVFEAGGDPVELGLVSSLNRPGGNVTGISNFFGPLAAKRLEVLRDLAPYASAIGVLANPSNPTTASQVTDIQAAGRNLGLSILVVHGADERDLEAAFRSLEDSRIKALAVTADPFFANRRAEVTALASRRSMAAVYSHRDFVVAGGLISYGTDLTDVFRQVGGYTGQILRGTRPGDLPVLQPAKFELVINLKAAKTLGITVPPTLLARADEVITR